MTYLGGNRESFTKGDVELQNSESEIYWILYCEDNIKYQLFFQEENCYTKYSKYVILESTDKSTDVSKIDIIDNFGNDLNLLTGEYCFRDYIAYP